MKAMLSPKPLATAMMLALLVTSTIYTSVYAKEKTPGFNQEIPGKIMTPDKVETHFGTLNFVDGVPTAETTQRLYDNLDYLRGVEVFLNFIPATSMEGLRLGAIETVGGSEIKSNQAIIMDQLMDSNPLYLTGNTDTVYCMIFLDLEKDGPTVIEIPAGTGPGTVDDAFFRFVIDLGAPGPDAGKGGKYLILPPDYKGEQAHRGRRPSGGQWREVLRRSIHVLRELGTAARLPRRWQTRCCHQDVQRRRQSLFAGEERQPAEDGVHQRLEEPHQHGSRQQHRVL